MKSLEHPLSPRECEILRLVARGYTNPMIATYFGTSLHTVKAQTQSIFRKLVVKNRVQAAMYAVRSGIVKVR